VAVEKVKDFQSKFSDYVSTRKESILEAIRKEKAVTDSVNADLLAAITEFKQTYK